MKKKITSRQSVREETRYSQAHPPYFLGVDSCIPVIGVSHEFSRGVLLVNKCASADFLSLEDLSKPVKSVQGTLRLRLERARGILCKVLLIS